MLEIKTSRRKTKKQKTSRQHTRPIKEGTSGVEDRVEVIEHQDRNQKQQKRLEALNRLQCFLYKYKRNHLKLIGLEEAIDIYTNDSRKKNYSLKI